MTDAPTPAAVDPLERLFEDGPQRPPVVIVIDRGPALVDEHHAHPFARLFLLAFLLWCVIAVLVDELDPPRTAPRRAVQ